MQPATYERFVDIFTERSAILTAEKFQDEAIRNRPECSNAIFDLDGLRWYLRRLHHKADEDQGPVSLVERSKRKEANGLLPEAQRKLDKALNEWENFNSAQTKNAQKEEPQGIYAETINKLKAQITVYKKESKRINRILKADENKQEIQNIKKSISLLNVRKRGIVNILKNVKDPGKKIGFEQDLKTVNDEIGYLKESLQGFSI